MKEFTNSEARQQLATHLGRRAVRVPCASAAGTARS